MPKTRSLAIVASHAIQHYVPVYQHLAKLSGLRVKVFFVAENGAYEYFDNQFGQYVKWDVPLTEGYDFEFLSPGKTIESYGFWAVDDDALEGKIMAFKPDVIWVNGYAQRANWRALKLRSQGVKFIYSSDSNLEDRRSGWRLWLKHHIVKNFLKKCDYFLSYGPKNTRYLMHYGVSEEDIRRVTFPVDMKRLELQREILSESDIHYLKTNLGLSEEHKIALFAGKLIPHKRPADLIAAMDKLRDYNISAVIVGSGSLLPHLQKKVKELELEKRVVFTGFVNQSKMAEYFTLADVFVFPSEKEPYGAVASEVLPFGLPIVATNNIGSVGSSILESKNALIYRCGDVDQLSAHILNLFSDSARYDAFSAASVRMTDQHDASVMAHAIKDIIKPSQHASLRQ